MKTVHCEDCKYFVFPRLGFLLDCDDTPARCKKGKKVRFYNPKTNNYMDDDYGWKKKCGDFKLSKRVQIIRIGEGK